jgi:phosphoribosylamine--glycine ligase
MKILVIGSGGREHAICWALAQSNTVSEIVCVPGNGGTGMEKKCRNIPLPPELSAVEGFAAAAVAEKPDFVVVGPEDPLAAGVADRLWELGIPAVGPKQASASLEASKDGAKSFMLRHGVACGKSESFTDAGDAIAFIRQNDSRSARRSGPPFVVKADGLAAGKGVVVAADAAAAEAAVREFMVEGSLGEAGNRVLIEEYLRGVEISILAAVSVTPELAAEGRAVIVPFIPARDHKRLEEGARGPNTGGMGAVAPPEDVTPEVIEVFRRDILDPTLKGMIAEGMDYRGFIFFGLMLTADGPKLIEYNVRLGDPEAQAVLPLMDSDFAGLCQAITDGTLNTFHLEWKKGYTCAPVAVSAGYPGKYGKGFPVCIDSAKVEAAGAVAGAKIFIAGAVPGPETGTLVTSGGRVLAASAFGTTMEEARSNAYAALSAVSFEGMRFRRDIGLPGAAESGDL